MGINKSTAVVTAICAVLICTAGGVHLAHVKRAVNEVPSAPVEAVQPVEFRTHSPEMALPEDSTLNRTSEPVYVSLADLMAENVGGVEPETDEHGDEAVQPASVSGYVMDDAGYPLEDAVVHLEIAQAGLALDTTRVYDTRTGTDGAYQIGGIDAFGNGAAYASTEDYVMQAVWDLTLSPAGRCENVNFVLEKARFFVSGKVVSEKGEAITGASVNLREYRGVSVDEWPDAPHGDALCGHGRRRQFRAFYTTGSPVRFFCDQTWLRRGILH